MCVVDTYLDSYVVNSSKVER